MRVRLSLTARQELDDLADQYEIRQVGLGGQLTDDVRAFGQRVAVHPQLYAQIPRCPPGRDIRMTATDHFPVLIVYEVLATEIIVIAVTHAKAHPRRWRRRITTP